MTRAEWPREKLDLKYVEGWISEVLPGQPGVSGLIEVYHAKEWGVVARFRINANFTKDVVFKACFLDVYASGPLFYELLNRCCPGTVPTLLAWAKVNGQTWTLFEPFEGQSVARTPTLQMLTSIAQTLAHIQTKVVDLPQRDLYHLPRVEVADIPNHLDDITHYVREKHTKYWSKEEGPFSELMPELSKILGELAKFGEFLERWATELSAGGWPDTIDHTDLHPNNAVIRSDGCILIFDWEESKISVPFFSLDELLGRVRLFDRQRLDIKQQEQSSYTVGPWEQAVRDAYLDALPWGRQEDRERALDLALCLSPIRKVDEYMRFASELGRIKGNRYLAIIVTDALYRWRAMRVLT